MPYLRDRYEKERGRQLVDQRVRLERGGGASKSLSKKAEQAPVKTVMVYWMDMKEHAEKSPSGSSWSDGRTGTGKQQRVSACCAWLEKYSPERQEEAKRILIGDFV